MAGSKVKLKDCKVEKGKLTTIQNEARDPFVVIRYDLPDGRHGHVPLMREEMSVDLTGEFAVHAAGKEVVVYSRENKAIAVDIGGKEVLNRGLDRS